MTDYPSWVEAVLRVILQGGGTAFSFGIPQIGAAFGLNAGTGGVVSHVLAIDCAIQDLDDIGMLETAHASSVAPSIKARPFRTRSLRELWAELRAGDLEPDDEAYLAKLAELSEVRHEGWAEARWIDTEELFEALGWPWDTTRSLRVVGALKAYGFASGRLATVRLRLAGAVRVNDQVGGRLFEARLHLASQHPRAAGCLAGVELERGLKTLCATRSARVSAPLPGIADYNRALKGKLGPTLYPVAFWRRIDQLADVRNRCAHALDIEPTQTDAEQLLDGVEEALRTLEAVG